MDTKPTAADAAEIEQSLRQPDADSTSGSDLPFLNEEAASILLSVFAPLQGAGFQAPVKPQEVAEAPAGAPEDGSKIASVKFMITRQDEVDLRKLGYTEEQIKKLKPQQAADILKNNIPPGAGSDLPQKAS